MEMTFSIIGLGKLGASMLAAIAKRGFDVIGVDVLQHTVEQVNAGHTLCIQANTSVAARCFRRTPRGGHDSCDHVAGDAPAALVGSGHAADPSCLHWELRLRRIHANPVCTAPGRIERACSIALPSVA